MAQHPETKADHKAAQSTVGVGKQVGDGAAMATAQSTIRSGLSSVSDLADQSAGAAKKGMEDFAANGEAAARRSQGAMQAAAGAGSSLVSGAQDISQAWIDLAQARIQHMAEGMRALATCRTPADLIKAQAELLQGAMEQMIDTNRRVADVSMRVMQEVTSKITAPAEGENAR